VSALQLGYRNVFVMSAGIDGWKKAGKPVEKS
jgi:rhodanese-related sulfurtransferase